MIYHIHNQPKHIDVEFDVVGTLYKAYLFPETGTFEVACWNDGDESVYDGFFDPLQITDYDEYYGDNQIVCFDYQKAMDFVRNTLESALIEAGENYEYHDIEVHRIEVYGGDYEPPDDSEFDEVSEEYDDSGYDADDAPYCYDDDVNYW